MVTCHLTQPAITRTALPDGYLSFADECTDRAFLFLVFTTEREREERQTDRQTETENERQRQREHS